jgi:hypothetical protein
MKDLRKAYLPLFLYWLIIWIIIFLTSCNPRPYLLGLNGEVMHRDGNKVLIQFNHSRGGDYSYDYFYVTDSTVKTGTKAKIIFE